VAQQQAEQPAQQPQQQQPQQQPTSAAPQPNGTSTDMPVLAMPAKEATTASEWWMANLFDITTRTGDSSKSDDDEALPAGGWWMNNLFDIKTRTSDGATGEETAEEAFDWMARIFATPRGGDPMAATFTPRGGLAPLLQGGLAAGGKGSGFASNWVQQIFTPRNGKADAIEDVDTKMGDALEWLQQNFTTPRGTVPNAAPNAPMPTLSMRKPWAITPRGGGEANPATLQSDDAVMAAAMQAVLATPRSSRGGPSRGGLAVDDSVMAGAVSKMFKMPQRQCV